MKNNIKFYGFLTLLLVLVSACHSDLDRLPQSNLSQDNFYNDLTELEIGLAGVYDVMAKTKDGYGEGFIKMGVHGSHVATTFVGATKQNTQAWFTFDNSEESFNRVWGSAYKLIYRANQVIDRAAFLGAADGLSFPSVFVVFLPVFLLLVFLELLVFLLLVLASDFLPLVFGGFDGI